MADEGGGDGAGDDETAAVDDTASVEEVEADDSETVGKDGAEEAEADGAEASAAVLARVGGGAISGSEKMRISCIMYSRVIC